MKTLVFCICTLACISFISTESIKVKLQNALSSTDTDTIVEICAAEINITRDEFLGESDIINEVYLKSSMEERKRKSGCFIECILKRLGMMEGNEIKEEKIQKEVTKYMVEDPREVKLHKVIHDCIQEVKNITHECEKGFAMMVCIAKATHHLFGHEEHTSTTPNINEHTSTTPNINEHI
ncbi:pheromone-binding protein Gp-9-like [Odontomachus brunneus]|uniref:pheromone-binding protein Gp-9-like n=1 Tax=Odontomachus brunneus TaxID=486640 RepID=UPI0013F1D17D|nr:pheromone-binding protein Gp-9-like [Odontomachus brunneus]